MNISREESAKTGRLFVKGLSDTKAFLVGYGVIFGGEDLYGQYFSKSTNFMMDLVPVKLAFYDHRFVEVKHDIGVVRNESITQDDYGLWIEMELDRNKEYVDAILQLADKGALGFSSGSVAHLVEFQRNWIKQWPLIEFSPTPIPAEPKTLGIHQKSLQGSHVMLGSNVLKGMAKDFPAVVEAVGIDPEFSSTVRLPVSKSIPLVELLTTYSSAESKSADSAKTDAEGAGKAPHVEAQPESTSSSSRRENQPMAPEIINKAERPEDWKQELEGFLSSWMAKNMPSSAQPEQQASAANASSGMEQVQQQISTLNTQISKILEFVDSSSAMRNAGYVTDDGGDKDKHVRSFGDFLLAVKRKDHKRLAQVYKAAPPTRDLSISTGEAGYYLVPEEFGSPLLKMAAEANPITARVRKVPVRTGDAGRWPALDQFFAPTAGSGEVAWAGGVEATVTAPGQTLAKTEPSFEMIEWRLHKVGGYTEVDNELIEDSPESIEALLTGLFGIAIAAKNERNILRGSGAGEPLGILNSLAAVGISPAADNVFSWADVATMWSRYKSAGGSPVWTIHPSIWPDIMQMEVGTAGGAVWTANMQGPAAGGLNGFPILTSEHLPQANNSGAVLLADYSAYLMFEKSGLMIAFSEHAAFIQDQGTWRFTQRSDGKPWLRKPVTLADPQGSYTVSPFIYHND